MGEGRPNASTDQPARTALARRDRRALLQALDGDLKSRHTLLASDRGSAAVTHRADERLQLGAQRLRMAHREVAHRIAAIGLEAETFRDLPRQEITHDVFVARR